MVDILKLVVILFFISILVMIKKNKLLGIIQTILSFILPSRIYIYILKRESFSFKSKSNKSFKYMENR